MVKWLPSDQALEFLKSRGIERSPTTMHHWHRDGTLVAERRAGRNRLYSTESLNDFADRYTNPPHNEAIPMSKNLTSKSFAGGDAGAEATSKERNAKLATGGKGKTFSEQNADTAKSGQVGRADKTGAGKQFLRGGDYSTFAA
jgi:hypothetical protein